MTADYVTQPVEEEICAGCGIPTSVARERARAVDKPWCMATDDGRWWCWECLGERIRTGIFDESADWSAEITDEHLRGDPRATGGGRRMTPRFVAEGCFSLAAAFLAALIALELGAPSKPLLMGFIGGIGGFVGNTIYNRIRDEQ